MRRCGRTRAGSWVVGRIRPEVAGGLREKENCWVVHPEVFARKGVWWEGSMEGQVAKWARWKLGHEAQGSAVSCQDDNYGLHSGPLSGDRIGCRGAGWEARVHLEEAADMRETGRFARSEAFMKTLLAGAVLLWGCADLALEADRIPAELKISPDRAALRKGESAKLAVVVKDQDGEVIMSPSWVPTVWKASDETVVELGGDGTVKGLNDGRAVATARLAGMTADACVHVDPSAVRLTEPVIYLTQGAQNRENTIRLIAGRPALLRIFWTGDRTNSLDPAVQVTLLQDDRVVFQELARSAAERIPTSVDESDLSGSINVEVPGSVIQPGVHMVVELDSQCLLPLGSESPLRYPPEGSLELDVVELPLYRLILVPTIASMSPDSSVFAWTDGVTPDSEQLRLGRATMPVGAMEVEVYETYTTSADLRTPSGWNEWLTEIEALHEIEGSRGYYHGVVGSSPGNVRGMAPLGYPASVGVDEDYIYTHELGHAMNLDHAPCGGAIMWDPDYPHEEGAIGVWGYDFAMGRLLDPVSYKDVMGYCFDNIWISDYHFNKAMTHRLDGDGGVDHGADAAGVAALDRGEVLVVWGAVREGRLKLDPAFVVDGPVALPAADGPYRVEGLGAGGETRFSLAFSPTSLADGGGSTFVFLIPYEPEWARNLDRMVLTGPEGEYTVTRDGAPGMAVVTDRSTGRIRAIIRNWDGGPLPGEGTADVTITRGIPEGGLW